MLPILKIVTIDDSPLVSKRIKALLDEIQVIEFSGNAGNIPAALHLVEEQRPHVVILDIQIEEDITEGTGIDLLSVLRKLYPDMKLIVLTNNVELHYRINCIAKGANYFFDKTNDFSKLANVLKVIHSKLNEN